MAFFLLKPKQILIIYVSVTVQTATANQTQLANEVETLLPSQAVLCTVICTELYTLMFLIFLNNTVIWPHPGASACKIICSYKNLDSRSLSQRF